MTKSRNESQQASAPTFPSPRSTPPRCLRFDRRFAALGVPRLQHSSGTTDPAEFVRRNQLLTRIASAGLRDLLHAFASGEVDIDDLLRFERQEDLRNGLVSLREQRAEERARQRALRQQWLQDTHDRDRPAVRVSLYQVDTSPCAVDERPATENAHIDRPITEDLSGVTQAASSTAPAVHWSGVSINTDFSQPLWRTFHGVIGNMLNVVDVTRRRYTTSLNSLQLKIAACAASETQFQELAGISPDEWEALELARNRGLEVAVLRDAIPLPLAKQRALLAARGLRMTVEVFRALANVTREQWAVLTELAALPVTAQIIETLDHAPPEDREALRRLAATLSPYATIAALGQVTEGEWYALSRAWGASATDWNHVRRALSTCLSRHIGTDRHLFRQIVIDRIPLLKEHERIPDITLEKLGEVSSHLPESIRLFPWFIVLSGCRVSEYLRLEWQHLKPHVYMVDVPGRKTAAARRSVHITPDLWWVAETAVPCYLQYRQLRQHWVAACQRAGVSGVTIHDLRHVCGQSAADAGAKLESIQAHLGHANPEMAFRYARRRELKEGSERLGSLVLPHVLKVPPSQ